MDLLQYCRLCFYLSAQAARNFKAGISAQMAFCNAESAWPRYIYHLQKPLVSGLAVFDLQCRNSLINPDQTINYVNAHNTPSLCILGIIEIIRIQNDLFVAMENLDWILLFIFHSLMRMRMLVMMSWRLCWRHPFVYTSLCKLSHSCIRWQLNKVPTF